MTDGETIVELKDEPCWHQGKCVLFFIIYYLLLYCILTDVVDNVF